MKKIWILATRELKTFFDSLIAYIMLALFLGLTGFFTWIMFSDIFSTGQASLIPFFNVAYWSLFFFIPALTMKMFAEENYSRASSKRMEVFRALRTFDYIENN